MSSTDVAIGGGMEAHAREGRRMIGLVRMVVGLIFVWTIVAVTETAGIPVLPRMPVSLQAVLK
jgi:hypothetical protein